MYEVCTRGTHILIVYMYSGRVIKERVLSWHNKSSLCFLRVAVVETLNFRNARALRKCLRKEAKQKVLREFFVSTCCQFYTWDVLGWDVLAQGNCTY